MYAFKSFSFTCKLQLFYIIYIAPCPKTNTNPPPSARLQHHNPPTVTSALVKGLTTTTNPNPNQQTFGSMIVTP